jgi:hypothetical protein
MDIGYYGNLLLQDWPTDATVTSAAKGTPGDGGASGASAAAANLCLVALLARVLIDVEGCHRRLV